MEASEYPGVTRGEGYAVGDLDALGDGHAPEGETRLSPITKDAA
ncbi:MAG: hypothetical protein ACRDK7_00525 [Solirubrobacteraceae bacterium]